MLLTLKSRRRGKWRRFWLTVHQYLGLTLGLVFVLSGITGSLLVFYVELDEIVNPELQLTQEQAQQQPQAFETIYQALRQTHPDKTGAWRLEMPRHPQAMLMARYYKAKEKEHVHFAPLIDWINPVTAEVVSSRFWGDFAMTWIYDLHYELLLDKTGKIIMGVFGIFLLTSVMIGVYLWWPKTGKFKSGLTFKANSSKERFHYDLHKISGLYSLLVICLLLISGVILELPDYFNPVLNSVSPLRKADKILSKPTYDKPRISVDLAVNQARKRYPDAKLRWIETPANDYDAYNIRFYQDGEPSTRFAKTTVWIDQYSGEILSERNPFQHDSKGDIFLNWMHPLHSGEIIGLPGRIFVLLTGFIPAILFYTGFVRWLQKRKVKRLQRRLS